MHLLTNVLITFHFYSIFRIESNNLTYHSLFPAMLRARLDVLPKPHSLSDLISVLENDAYKCVSATSNFNEVLFKDFCTLPNGSSVILFMSQECASFLQTAPNVCVVHSLIGEVYNVSPCECFTPLCQVISFIIS